jgi:exodeoxyribonuclease VII small subunit
MTTPDTLPEDIRRLTFEEAMGQLEAIVRDLESGRGRLEDAIGAYERGTALRRLCEQKLSEAQAKIDRIVAGPDGTPATAPFDAGNG